MNKEEIAKTLEQSMKAKNCMGWCDRCEGELKIVHVIGNDRDWGYFKLCDNAIKVNKQRKFRVILLEEEKENE